MHIAATIYCNWKQAFELVCFEVKLFVQKCHRYSTLLAIIHLTIENILGTSTSKQYEIFHIKIDTRFYILT